MARASAAKARPTYSDSASIRRRISASASSATVPGPLRGVLGGVSCVPCPTAGAISDLLTLAEPQMLHSTSPAPSNLSKAAPEANQLSKLWFLSQDMA